VIYPIKDHHSPNFVTAAAVIADMSSFLNSNPENIVVAHCKAGKGRTGTMLCCLLLHENHRMSPEGAMHDYAFTRSQTGSASVDNPSQRRFVESYWQYIHNKPNLIEQFNA
jgi:phosphatidylinositol-3,4,5-trisphosphate 3-phosphatase/dual-specificity protein phosphatase PTEN